jgi:hypothetical protein
MKKLKINLTFLFVIALFQPVSLFADDPVVRKVIFEDAKTVVNNLKDTVFIQKLLSNYNRNGKKIVTRQDAEAAMPGNKFLETLISILPDNSNLNVSGKINTDLVTPQAGGSFFNPSIVADALGTFIAERFKTELNIAYLNKFKSALDSVPELKTLLPETYKILRNNDPYQYTTFFESLKEAFQKDMQNLAINSEELLKTADKDHPSDEIKYIIITLHLFNSINNGTRPVDAIEQVVDFEYTNNITDPKLKDAILIIGVASGMFRSSENEKIWMDAGDFKQLVSDPLMLKIFLGLTYERYYSALDTIKFKDGRKLRNYFDSIASSYDEQYKLVKTIYDAIKEKLNEVGTLTTKLTSMRVADEKTATLQKLTSATMNLLGAYRKLDSIIKISDKDIVYPLELLVNVINFTVDKKYGLAFNNLVILIDTTNIIPNSSPKSLQKLIKYGNFVVTAAVAENAGELKTALDAAALPVGGYRIKRNTKWSSSLFAYAGGFAGREHDLETGIWKNTIGFTAPVGVNLSYGFELDGKKGGWSVSLCLSFIDVGAFTVFRLNDTTSKDLPEVTWDNLFSPGAFLTIDIKNSPLSLYGGYQHGPQLRKITSDEVTSLSPNESWRIGLLVDIPVFQLYTSNKKE